MDGGKGMKREIKIADKILNKLISKENLHNNELFIFWDILKSVHGETSCIDEHNSIAIEILSELESEKVAKG